MSRFVAPRVPHRGDGFSIVEVIVALVIMVMISSAVARAVVATGTTQQQAKARTQQVAIAEGGLERLQADAGWAKTSPCLTATMKCTITSSGFTCSGPVDAQGWCVVTEQLDSGDAVKFQVHAKATGYDNPADGTGLDPTDANRDRDGLVPDFFRVEIDVRPQAVGAANFDASLDHHLTGDVNPVTRANTGSVQVQTCALTRQIDHRQPVMHCPRQSGIRMYPPVEFSGAWKIGAQGCEEENDECDGRYSRDDRRINQTDADSVDGLAFSSVTEYRRFLEFTPVGGVGYTLTPLKSDSLTVDPSRAVVTGQTQADGTGISQSVTAGQYRISFFNIPDGFVTWDDHSLPGDGLLAVSTGVMTHVSELFQPRPVTLTIGLSHLEETYFMTSPTTSVVTSSVARLGTESSDSLRLIAAPLERVPVFGVNAPGRIVGDGEMVRISRNSPQATFHNVTPGLYAAYVVTGTNTGSDFKVSTVEDGRLQSEPQADFKKHHPDLDYIFIDLDGTVHAGGREVAEGSAIWYNTYHSTCQPTSLCGGGGGGGGNGGASSSGGSGGL